MEVTAKTNAFKFRLLQVALVGELYTKKMIIIVTFASQFIQGQEKNKSSSKGLIKS